MHLGKIAFVAVLGFALTTQAEENVMVDLSVLDNLNSSYVAPAEPLFPVLPKKAKAAPRKIKKAAKPVKTERRQPEVGIKEPLPEPVQKVEVIESAPVVVVDVEPVAPLVVANPNIAEAKAPEVETVTAPIAAPDSEVSAPEAKTETAPIAEKTPLPVEPVAEIDDQSVEKEIAAPSIATEEAEAPALLVDDTVLPVIPAAERSIAFSAGVDELSAEQMAKIDEIVGRFKDVNTNKIAIYSYNLDDGVDSFKKKRLSLNRAVEVRSYLIKQGYKNFSIKVININSDSEKVNTVELEEI